MRKAALISWMLLSGGVAFVRTRALRADVSIPNCELNSDEREMSYALFENLKETILERPYGLSSIVSLVFDIPKQQRSDVEVFGQTFPLQEMHFKYDVGQEPGHPRNAFVDLSFEKNNISIAPRAIEVFLREDWDNVTSELMASVSWSSHVQKLLEVMLQSNPPFSYVLRITQLMMTIALSHNSGTLKVQKSVKTKKGKYKKKTKNISVPFTFRDVPFEVYVLTSRLYHTISGLPRYHGETLQKLFSDAMPCILFDAINKIKVGNGNAGLADAVYRMLPDFSRAFAYDLNARENLTTQLSLDELFVRVVAFLNVIVDNMDSFMRAFTDVLDKHAHVEDQEEIIDKLADVVLENNGDTFETKFNALMQAWTLVTSEIKNELDGLGETDIQDVNDIPVIHDLNHARYEGSVLTVLVPDGSGNVVHEQVGTFLVKEIVRLHALTRDLRGTYGMQQVDEKLNLLFSRKVFSGGVFAQVGITSFADIVHAYNNLPNTMKTAQLKLPPPSKKDQKSSLVKLVGAVQANIAATPSHDSGGAPLQTVGQRSTGRHVPAKKGGVLLEHAADKNIVKLST